MSFILRQEIFWYKPENISSHIFYCALYFKVKSNRLKTRKIRLCNKTWLFDIANQISIMIHAWISKEMRRTFSRLCKRFTLSFSSKLWKTSLASSLRFIISYLLLPLFDSYILCLLVTHLRLTIVILYSYIFCC